MQTGIQISSLKPLLTSEDQVRAAFLKAAGLGCSIVQLQWIDPSVPLEAIADALAAAGLRSVSVQDLYESVQENPAYYLRLNALTGGRWLCVSRVPERLKSAEGLSQFVQKLTALTDAAKQYGQQVCFHPVSSDYALIKDVCPVDYLLGAIPELRLCLDLYHLNKAGYAMPDWILKHAKRIVMVHIKDAKGGRLVPAGQGDLCWDGVVEACVQAGVQYAFVEQETWEKDPFLCLGEALDWARKAMKKTFP